MKRLPLFLFLALCGLSVSLAFGWWQVYQTKKQIEVQLKQNQELIYRNAALQAEIQDLKSSQDAVQERARLQLGMIKRNEVFVQVMDQPSTVQPSASNPQNQQAATAAGNAASATQPNTQANQANPQTSAQPNAQATTEQKSDVKKPQ